MAGDTGADLTGSTDLAARVGRRLRRRRTVLGLTLGEVSLLADVSDSHLSAIETGSKMPSLPILARVVAALGLSLHEVLQDVAVPAVRAGRLDRGVRGAQAASHADLRLRVSFLVVVPGNTGKSPVPIDRSEVFVYVSAGELTVVVDGAPYRLGAGDSLDTDPASSITYAATGDGESISVWASAPSSDDSHP